MLIPWILMLLEIPLVSCPDLSFSVASDEAKFFVTFLDYGIDVGGPFEIVTEEVGDYRYIRRHLVADIIIYLYPVQRHWSIIYAINESTMIRVAACVAIGYYNYSTASAFILCPK